MAGLALESVSTSFGIQGSRGDSYSTRRLTLAFVLAVFFYELSGLAMLISTFVISHSVRQDAMNQSSVAMVSLSLQPIDLRGGIASGIIITLAVLLALPGIFVKSTRFLKASAIMNVLSILSTLGFGLSIWFATLVERREYLGFWQKQSEASAAIIQDKFNCCGYLNSTTPAFTTSTACPNAAIALVKQGCYLPFTNYADLFL